MWWPKNQMDCQGHGQQLSVTSLCWIPQRQRLIAEQRCTRPPSCKQPANQIRPKEFHTSSFHTIYGRHVIADKPNQPTFIQVVIISFTSDSRTNRETPSIILKIKTTNLNLSRNLYTINNRAVKTWNSRNQWRMIQHESEALQSLGSTDLLHPNKKTILTVRQKNLVIIDHEKKKTLSLLP